MMFKSKLATVVGALVLAGSSFAMHGAPEACPSIASVQSEGMTMAAEILENLYLTYNISHFDTPYDWVFVMGPVHADADDEALEESNEVLTTVSGNPSPEQEGDDSWICQYDTHSQDIAAFALLTDEAISPLKLSQHLRRNR